MIVFNFTMVAILMIVFNFTMVAILAQVCFLFAHPPHPLVCLSPFRLSHLDVGDWVPGGGLTLRGFRQQIPHFVRPCENEARE